MLSRSAPSAKILILSELASVTASSFRVVQNPNSRLGQIAHDRVRILRLALIVASIDEDGRHAGRLPSLDVAPPVSHQVAPGQVEIVPARSVEQHPRLRLSTVAV